MQRLILLTSTALVLLAGCLFSPNLSQAQGTQGGRLCFNVPGVKDCVEGRFRQYWEQNGGLAVFGYPISSPMMHKTDEGSILVQFFERSRFELHPKNPRPFDVLLTRLGDERLKQQGRDWQTFPKGAQKTGCLFFAETGHSICNQEGNVGFKSYWESHGLREPLLNPLGRSLALFGLPLSEPMTEKNAAGQSVLVQWFERARFEYQPSNPTGFKVTLGLLGNETQATLPPPGGACGDIGLPSGAVIEPNCVKVGTTFAIEVSGFAPNQELNYWIADETGFIVGTVQQVRADAQGHSKVSVDTRNFSGAALAPGNYVFVARDVEETILPATAPFRVVP